MEYIYINYNKDTIDFFIKMVSGHTNHSCLIIFAYRTVGEIHLILRGIPLFLLYKIVYHCQSLIINHVLQISTLNDQLNFTASNPKFVRDRGKIARRLAVNVVHACMLVHN